MRDWREDSKCSELAPEYEVPREEWKETDGDNERIRRSIWYLFFEGYEADPEVAQEVDAICLSCPVIKECFEFGTNNNGTGIFGGVYLNRGNIDPVRNEHKSEEDWANLMELVQ